MQYFLYLTVKHGDEGKTWYIQTTCSSFNVKDPVTLQMADWLGILLLLFISQTLNHVNLNDFHTKIYRKLAEAITERINKLFLKSVIYCWVSRIYKKQGSCAAKLGKKTWEKNSKLNVIYWCRLLRRKKGNTKLEYRTGVAICKIINNSYFTQFCMDYCLQFWASTFFKKRKDGQKSRKHDDL